MLSDNALESALRRVIKDHNKSGSNDAISVNDVRTKAEERLKLQTGFFKSEAWKAKSKRIIHDEIDIQGGSDGSTAKKRSPSPPKPPRKKAKLEIQEDPEDSTALSEPPDSEDVSPPPKSKKPSEKPVKKAAPKQEPSKAVESDEDMPDPTISKPSKPMEDDSSDLSSVLDEPVSKKRSKSTESKTKAKSTRSKTTESDPNTEEIKRLQGWLVKCGIRKVWGKELKPFDTPKAKINHLKSLLSDVGMTGRYSNEKAAAIKEERELQADLDAVQEGNEKWGKEIEEEDNESQPRKRLVRGAQNYDFLSSDGEETD